MGKRLGRRAVLAGAGALMLAGPARARQTGEARLAALVSAVSQERLRADVHALAGFATRWSLAPDFPAVEAWMEAALADVGVPGKWIGRQPYDLAPGVVRHNIVTGNPRDGRGIILIGAHLDSISEDPARHAPGANDNATGIAALLEALRILGPLPLAREIVCVAFTGEEQEQRGSAACAALARNEGWHIDLMLNLDMLGHRPADPAAPLVIEYDQGNARPDNDAEARRMGEMAVDLARRHTSLAVETGDIWGSDYMAFEAQGYPCIGLYDNGVDSPQYHSTADLPEHVDFTRLEQATRLVVAIVASAAGLTG